MCRQGKNAEVKRTGESLIRMSYSCLFCPVLNAIFGVALLVLKSASLRPPVEGLFVIVYLVSFLTIAASYASTLFACLGIALALLGLAISQTRREVFKRGSLAVLLNVLAIFAAAFWVLTI